MNSLAITRHLTRSQEKKIALIILFVAITIPLLFFFQTIDDFIPKHIATTVDLLMRGGFSVADKHIIQTPGFYLLGAILVLIPGFSPESLLISPIQLIPYLVLLFYLLYRICGNAIIAATITLIDLCSGVTGTGKIFFWPHGIGTILFFVILILIIGFFRNKRKNEYISLVMLSGASLVFLSYNLTAMTLILLVVVILLTGSLYFGLFRFGQANRAYLIMSKTLLVASIVIFCVEMGLSRFTYGVFIPTLEASQDFSVSAFEKFSISYLDPELEAVIISPIMVHHPISISIISACKYGLLAITILIFCLFLGKSIYKKWAVEDIDLILISVVFMEVIYSIPRIMIGGIMVTAAWLPGILSLARLTRASAPYRLWSAGVLVALLILTFASYGIYFTGGTIDRVNFQTDGYSQSNEWINDNTDGAPIISDELTRNFKILNDVLNINQGYPGEISYYQAVEHSHLMSSTEAGVLANLQPGNLDQQSYYVLNKRLSRLSLENWIVIQSWKNSNTIVAANDKIDKIYDCPLLAIYRPTSNMIS